MILAVNGTLMHGFDLNPRILNVGGKFISSGYTAPVYRLWSVQDRYPGMIRVEAGGAAIEVELWEVPAEGILKLVEAEPPGLCLGRILLDNQRVVLGILAEPHLVSGCREITDFGGWRQYINPK